MKTQKKSVLLLNLWKRPGNYAHGYWNLNGHARESKVHTVQGLGKTQGSLLKIQKNTIFDFVQKRFIMQFSCLQQQPVKKKQKQNMF